MSDRRRAGVRACGGTPSHLLGQLFKQSKNIYMKYTIALGWPEIENGTQQQVNYNDNDEENLTASR